MEQAQAIKAGIDQVESCIMQSTREAMNSEAHRLVKVLVSDCYEFLQLGQKCF